MQPPEEAIQSLVRRQELFARRQVEPVLSATGLGNAHTVWFGVGISTDTISADLPFDVMILLYAQELLRRTLGWKHSAVLVADSNALSSGLSDLDVRRASSRVRRRLECVAARLGFPLSVMFASDIAKPVERLLADIDVDNPYLAQQMAQTEVMRRSGAGLKLGWTLSSTTHDETFFDAHYRAHFGELASFVYAIGGRTLASKRPRACPYLCKERSERLLLAPDERIVDKLQQADATAARGARRLLAKLARAHKTLTGQAFDAPETFAQQLVDQLDAELGSTQKGRQAEFATRPGAASLAFK